MTPMSERIRIIQADITGLSVHVIVNAANQTLLGGGGVDGAIQQAAGPELLKECESLGGCETGKAKVTKGYNLFAKHVIHAVGPDLRHMALRDGVPLLISAYVEALKLADELEAASVAFPCISTGVFAFPPKVAAEVAVKTVFRYQTVRKKTNVFVVVLCAFDDVNFQALQDAYRQFVPDSH